MRVMILMDISLCSSNTTIHQWSGACKFFTWWRSGEGEGGWEGGWKLVTHTWLATMKQTLANKQTNKQQVGRQQASKKAFYYYKNNRRTYVAKPLQRERCTIDYLSANCYIIFNVIGWFKKASGACVRACGHACVRCHFDGLLWLVHLATPPPPPPYLSNNLIGCFIDCNLIVLVPLFVCLSVCPILKFEPRELDFWIPRPKISLLANF